MRTALRIVGFIIGALIAFVVIVVVGLYANLLRIRTTQYPNPVPALTVARTPELSSADSAASMACKASGSFPNPYSASSALRRTAGL